MSVVELDDMTASLTMAYSTIRASYVMAERGRALRVGLKLEQASQLLLAAMDDVEEAKRPGPKQVDMPLTQPGKTV